jgi:hypothetical protein
MVVYTADREAKSYLNPGKVSNFTMCDGYPMTDPGSFNGFSVVYSSTKSVNIGKLLKY